MSRTPFIGSSRHLIQSLATESVCLLMSHTFTGHHLTCLKWRRDFCLFEVINQAPKGATPTHSPKEDRRFATQSHQPGEGHFGKFPPSFKCFYLFYLLI